MATEILQAQLQFLLLEDVEETGKELGRGAYGVVTEVKVAGLVCAGKKLHDAIVQRSTLDKFGEECLCHSRQRHPNIVQLMGVYYPPSSQLPMLVMEYLPLSLTQCLETQHDLPLQFKYSILLDVAKGLAYLHRKRPPIVHRDLTANNILLTSNLTAKISDLGVSRMADTFKRHQLTLAPGNAIVMPPEALEDNPQYDHKLDVFSYGCLILHVLTGQFPEPSKQFIPKPGDHDSFVKVSEWDRRSRYIEQISKEDELLPFAKQCLTDQPTGRPEMIEAVEFMERILSNYSQMKSASIVPIVSISSTATLKITTAVAVPLTGVSAATVTVPPTCVSTGYRTVTVPPTGVSTGTVTVPPTGVSTGTVTVPPTSVSTGTVTVPPTAVSTGTVIVPPTGVNTATDTVPPTGVSAGTVTVPPTAVSTGTVTVPPTGVSTATIATATTISIKDIDNVKLTKQLKDLNIYEVWEGIWNQKQVLITKSKCQGKFMMKPQIFRKLCHVNIVKNYTFLLNNELSIVTEYMSNGILRDYLRTDIGRQLTLSQLIDIAAQIASGMIYLGEQLCVHRNLAAKSIMIGEKNKVKIANFGLARLMNDDGKYINQYGDKYPIRWAAPETFDTHLTVKSDVWSFGVLLTELITYGEEPYPDMTLEEVVEAVQTGYRMPIPAGCPEPLYNIMLDCWKAKPEERPTFEYLNDTFKLPYCMSDKWETIPSSVKLIKRLDSKGMWEGQWKNNTPVNVKTIIQGTRFIDFLVEIQILKKLHHEHIDQLLATSTLNDPLYIVTEYMKNGILSDYLRTDIGRQLTLSQLIDIAAQIANGMIYLGEQHCIHRDLAVRSIMIGEGNKVKIVNFGFARLMNDGNKYIAQKEEKYPIRWTAPEAFDAPYHLTVKSDVWSFGVLLTELITYGDFPYPGMTNNEAVGAVKTGYRMPIPAGCPETLYNIMLDCWNAKPEERPTFEHLNSIFKSPTCMSDEWETDPSSVKLIKRLDSNGMLWEGQWKNNTPVNVKKIVQGIRFIDFLVEIQILKKLRHEHIIHLLATSTLNDPLYIIMKYMSNGILCDYLRTDIGFRLALSQLIDIAAQIVSGMIYLGEQHCVHRDIAAKNIMIGEGNKIKIANFGFARLMNDGDKYIDQPGDKYPIKWTAPEIFDTPASHHFTVKSDVWSFGVLLTELITYGRPPYPGMTNSETVGAVKTGYRMPIPVGCPEPLYNIMLDCWKINPEKRPTFKQLQVILSRY